jgi:hypothetical protein
MKIEQLIVQYLYEHKKVTIQNIGTFLLSQDITVPSESEKDGLLPDNAISFEYNNKATQDESLVDYIVQQTKKIKPLASSDLESFSILTRQFINIGKPLVIEGLGTLQKNQAGQYEFIQGHTITHAQKAEPVHGQIKEKEKAEIDFSSPRRPQAGNRWLLPVFLILVVLGALAFLYFKYNQNQKGKEPNLLSVKQDTIPVKKDTTSLEPTPALPVTNNTAQTKKDSFDFKIVIKEYPDKNAAMAVFNRLTRYGHKLLLYPKDSVAYKIAMPFMRPLADTNRMRDSLRIFFGGRPYVETN